MVVSLGAASLGPGGLENNAKIIRWTRVSVK